MTHEQQDLLTLQRAIRNFAALMSEASAIAVRATVVTILTRYGCKTIAECETRLMHDAELEV